jgi:putative transposase
MPDAIFAHHSPRHRLSPTQKLFWLLLRKLWAEWKKPLILVTPRTVVEWHRAGFRVYWKWLSRASQVHGRKPVSREVRALIFQMAAENPTWGAPRIHGELLKLGFDLSEPTVSRWLRRAPRCGQVLANVLAEPSRGHCRHGLFHRCGSSKSLVAALHREPARRFC